MPNDRKRMNSRLIAALATAAFFLIQLSIDLAHSVTAFPFVHFGMFSASLPASDSLLIYEVTVNGQRLQPADYRIYRWDMIQQPLAAFDKQITTDDFIPDKQKFQSALPWIYQRAYANLNNQTTNQFPSWYHDYLSRLTGQPIHSLQVTKIWYGQNHGQLMQLRKAPWIDLE
jgi:hypothetical protein